MMLGCILSRPPSAVNKSGISEADDAAVLKDAEHPLPQHKEDGFGIPVDGKKERLDLEVSPSSAETPSKAIFALEGSCVTWTALDLNGR